MEISEVRVKLVGGSSDRLRAFCSVTFDGEFVVRDLKIIDGATGPFVAMPSRKLADRCPKCSGKNHLRARFCNSCGASLREDRVPKDRNGRSKLHADVAHPINSACRERIQARVIEAYEEEVALSKTPGYVPTDLDDDMLGDYEEEFHGHDRSPRRESVEVERVEEEDVDRSGAMSDRPVEEPASASDDGGSDEESDSFGTGVL